MVLGWRSVGVVVDVSEHQPPRAWVTRAWVSGCVVRRGVGGGSVLPRAWPLPMVYSVCTQSRAPRDTRMSARDVRDARHVQVRERRQRVEQVRRQGHETWAADVQHHQAGHCVQRARGEGGQGVVEQVQLCHTRQVCEHVRGQGRQWVVGEGPERVCAGGGWVVGGWVAWGQ